MAAEDQQPEHDTPPMPPPRNLRRVGLVAVVAAIVIAVFGILQRRGHEAEVKQWTQQQAVPTVAVITPRQGPSVQRLVLPGTVQAWYEAPIYARVSGYLKNWYFDYGAHVKKGDLLAEIDAPDLDAQLAAAQAKLNSARAVVKVREAESQFAEFDLSALAGLAQGRRLGTGTGGQASRLQQRGRASQLCDSGSRCRPGRGRPAQGAGRIQEDRCALRRRRHRA